MDGLDRVRGPHWSKILQLHGPGGLNSEALKDRTQVQLKYKERNLKLFFLKSKIEVPYYLSNVTGDLRTRAPGQAEKFEAEELEGLSEDDAADPMEGVQDAMEQDGELARQDAGHNGRLGNTTQQEGLDTAAAMPDMADIEAMIARAAAEAEGPM